MPNIEIPGVTTAAQRAEANANTGRPVPGHYWREDGFPDREVLPNDRAVIYHRVYANHIPFRNITRLMSPPDIFLADDAEGKTYDYSGLNGHPSIRAVIRRGVPSQTYRSDFENFLGDWFRYQFVGGPRFWYKAPLTSYTGKPWWRDGLDGYGQHWVWLYARPVPSNPQLLDPMPYIIATQSHRTDPNTRLPVDNFLPVHPPSPSS